MIFSSPSFLFFFLPIVILGYYLLRKTYRIYFLTISSLLFYAWGEPKHVLVMVSSIGINYAFGLLVNATGNRGGGYAKAFLWLAVICNIGILFYFKYLNFMFSTLESILDIGLQRQGIIMPIGISFFTFQGMSYVIDLYYEKTKVQKNPVFIAFYISFFPQLIAGPIVRYVDIAGQIYSRNETLEAFVGGAKRFIIGLGKKVIIANTVGYTADQIFGNPAIENTMATAWLGVICYSFQIFFDFSGYSDMAIGLGKMFGFDFLENFNYPYISKSVTEFWRRWHISLSTWFRDYVYIPLGGNRTGNVYVNLLIVFVITGIWHGASFNFLVWGLWHGLFLIIERLLKPTYASTFRRLFFHLMTMFVVLVGWVFFRADGLEEALVYLGVMFSAVHPENVGYTIWYYLDTKITCMLIIAALASLPIAKSIFPNSFKRKFSLNILSCVTMLLLFCVSIMFVVASSYNPFIYFRF